jgi:hypothetical protein
MAAAAGKWKRRNQQRFVGDLRVVRHKQREAPLRSQEVVQRRSGDGKPVMRRCPAPEFVDYDERAWGGRLKNVRCLRGIAARQRGQRTPLPLMAIGEPIPFSALRWCPTPGGMPAPHSPDAICITIPGRLTASPMPETA